MELIISSGVLTLFLLVGAFVDFVLTASSLRRRQYAAAFSEQAA